MAKGAKGFRELFDKKAAEERAKESQERQSKRGGGGSNFFSFPKGKTIFRVLPPGSESLLSQGLMGKVVYKHYLWFEGKSQGVFTSGIRTFPNQFDTCPIQDAIDKVEPVVPEKEFKRLNARGRGVFNIMIRKIEDSNQNPIDRERWGTTAILESPIGFVDWIQTQMMDSDIGLFVDPYAGLDVICTKTGEGLETKYNYQVKPGEFLPVSYDPDKTAEQNEADTDALLDTLPDIEKIVTIKPEQIEKQHAASRKIIEWGSTFGKVSQEGVGESSLERLMSAASGEQAKSVQMEEKVTTAEAQPPEKTPDVSPPGTSDDGSPECFGEFKTRNPNEQDPDKPEHEQCKDCDYILPCSFE